MNIQQLVTDNYDTDNNYIDLTNKLNHLTNKCKLDIIRYIGDNYPGLRWLSLTQNKISSLGNSLDKLTNLQYLCLVNTCIS